jgi:hypothetical protein
MTLINRFVLLLLLFLSACVSAPSPSVEPQATTVQLPLEVMGIAKTSQSVSFTLGDTAGITTLYLQCHRCAYEDASVDPQHVKATVSVNGGTPIPLTNSNSAVRLATQDRAFGGLGGGYHTVRMWVTLNGLRANAQNTLTFSFQGTDTLTSGYRILAFNLLRGGQAVLPSSFFTQDNPATWQPPLPSGVTTGKALWEGSKAIKEFPGGPTTTASCSDCHAADGRDLKYFNYSNKSIEVRSQFHSLSTEEGKQIASYIRSLTTPAPAQARPWNPPYQPGPGLDASAWAAGAGLQCVLNSDREMLPYLFSSNPPKDCSTTSRRALVDTSSAVLNSVIDSAATLNVREMPIAMQLPDWNAWLPKVYPEDVWSNFATAVEQPGYLTTKNTLKTGSATAKFAAINNHYFTTYTFIGKGATRYNNNTAYPWLALEGGTIGVARSQGLSAEEAKKALASWSAVKLWELMQESGLEDNPRSLLPGAEKRAWPIFYQSVFHLAPHMVGDNRNNFAWQNAAAGDYDNNAWYQLQMTLNAGQKQAGSVDPVDWDYQLRHIYELGEATGVWHSARFVQTNLKMYQERNNGQGPKSTGWMLRTMHPRWLYSNERENTALMAGLNSYQSGLWGRTVTAFLDEFLAVVAKPEFNNWPRLNTNQINQRSALFDAWYKLEPTSYKPDNSPFNDGGAQLFFPLTYLNHAKSLYKVMPNFKAQGVNSATLQRLAAWAEARWPQGDWSKLLE